MEKTVLKKIARMTAMDTVSAKTQLVIVILASPGVIVNTEHAKTNAALKDLVTRMAPALAIKAI